MMGDGEYASVIIAGRTHKVEKRDPS